MSAIRDAYLANLSQVQNILKKLLFVNKGIKAIVISSFDGTPLVSSTSDPRSTALLAAIAATLHNVAEKAGNVAGSGGLKKIVAHYVNDKIIVIAVNHSYNVLVRASEETPLGVILRDLFMLIDKIHKLVTSISR
ncbi:MAG: roadblock/LC7 domain-containing protein [Candidatus Njordarchaeales archaeon]